MKYLKVLGISFGFILGLFFILTFLTTLLSYFNIINSNIVGIIKIIIPTVSLLIGSFIVGNHAIKMGWLEGLKLSAIVIILIMLFNYLAFGNKIEIKDFIYYLILMTSAIFGSMIGISKKKIES